MLRTIVANSAACWFQSMNDLVLSSFDPGARIGYWVAVLGALMAVGLRMVVAPLFDGHSFLLFYVPVVLAAAVLGGRGPALLAMALCIGMGGLALDGRIANEASNWVSLIVFVVLSLLIAFAAGRLRLNVREAGSRRLLLESILKTIPDAMVVIDDTGVIRQFSPAATRMFGWSEDEAVGRNIELLMSASDGSAHDVQMTHYLRTGENRVIDVGRVVTGLRKDGSSLPLDLWVGETLFQKKRFFTGFMRDLSDQQAEDAKLRHLQEQLAHNNRVTAMGHMASMLAHEVNQPLTAIANYTQAATELLSGPSVDVARARIALAAANQQSIRAGLVVRHLGQFVTKGQGTREDVDLTPVIEDALSLALVGEHNVQLIRTIATNLPRVNADPIQIQQVVVNLVRNAIHAMAGAGLLELRVVARNTPAEVVITVSDRGAGLSPRQINDMFEPFRSHDGQGMGLGLSICREIVESHGGRITGRNRKGGGAQFRFTLPHTGDLRLA